MRDASLEDRQSDSRVMIPPFEEGLLRLSLLVADKANPLIRSTNPLTAKSA